MRATSNAGTGDASGLITARIESLADWRGEALARIRTLIREADPDIVEEWKWDVPVWSHDGIVCTGEVYKHYVKLTFAKGASVDDPKQLFNSSLTGNTRRAIDVRADDRLDAEAFRALVRRAVAVNQSAPKKATARKSARSAARPG